MCSYQVETWRGEKRFAYVEKLDTTNDLAVLRLSIAQDPWPAFGVRFGVAPPLGTTVCAAPSRPVHVHKCGEVYPYTKPPGDISFGIIVEPGNSGSGVYNEDGELVGIVTALRPCANKQWCAGYATSLATHLKDLL
jgi:hypothetical protein